MSFPVDGYTPNGIKGVAGNINAQIRIEWLSPYDGYSNGMDKDILDSAIRAGLQAVYDFLVLAEQSPFPPSITYIGTASDTIEE